MSSQTTPASLLFDRRLMERNLRKGFLTQAEVDARLAAIPDCSANAERVAASLHDEPAVDEDGEEGDDDEG